MNALTCQLSEYTVYCHRNKINGKLYFGITSQPFEKRWKKGKGYSGCIRFERAIQKYGWDNFDHIIIGEHFTKAFAELIEESLISFYETQGEAGYNSESGGHTQRWSQEMKDKLSKTRREEWTKDPHRYDGSKNPNYNNHWSDDQKARMSRIKKGTPVSEETKRKISLSTSGEKNHNYGKAMSDEQKAKISASKKGKKLPPRDDAYRKRLSEALKGRTFTEEHRKNISESLKGNIPYNRKKVLCVELGLIFDCARLAHEATGTNTTAIHGVCRGLHERAGGYHWKYI